MEKKGGDYYCRLCRRHLFLALVLILLTLLLLDLANNPFLFTYLSSHDVSAIRASASAEPSVQNEEGEFQSLLDEETREPIEEVLPKDDNEENGASLTEIKVCNYAKGRWVADSSYPLYSAECKYIMRKYACRLTNRTDFSYESYRWHPRDCSMPKFDPSAFLKRLIEYAKISYPQSYSGIDKKIAFIGDSLSREQFQSLMCMLTGGKDSPDVEDIASKYDFLSFLRSGAVHHHGWAYRFQSTNTTILHSWSARLCPREPINATDPNTLYAMHLDRQPAFIQEHINDLDVLVLNTAHHWSLGMINMDKEIMYSNGKPLEDKNLWKIENAKIFKVNNIVKWLHSKIILRPKLRVFFRSVSPRHFLKGDWNTGGSCPNTVPMTRGSEVMQDESSDKILSDAVKGTEVEILDITAISDLRDEAHISHYGEKAHDDCLHWCLPGVPDTWNELLNVEL